MLARRMLNGARLVVHHVEGLARLASHSASSLSTPPLPSRQRLFASPSFSTIHVISKLSSTSLDRRGEAEEAYEDEWYTPRAHVPVLLTQVLSAFRDTHLHTFVDCTLGAGGHASAMIKDHVEMKTFVGLDVDPIAHSEATSRLQEAVESRLTDSAALQLHRFQTNFRNVKSVLEQLGLGDRGVDGILMDLGMSSMQSDIAERGFSLQQDGPTDMRMDPLLTLRAEDILNGWPEAEIGRILRDYGEERQWKRLARKISEAQLAGGIHSTSKLLDIIQRCLPSKFSPGRQGWKKTAVRVFQALRIAVNDELTALQVALLDAYACLSSKGRLAVISFHSLEDRFVKQFFLKTMGEAIKSKYECHLDSKYDKHTRNDQEDAKGQRKRRNSEESTREEGRRNRVLEGKSALVLTKRPIVAELDEIQGNPRARSAKLRILEKK